MSSKPKMPREAVEALRTELVRDAEQHGYHINPDEDFAGDLAEGLLVNEGRFGYRSCPCRLSTGLAEEDLDIVCPCDYRDADLAEWGACYCALYVTQDVLDGRKELGAVPERRPPGRESEGTAAGPPASGAPKGSVAVWRCRVCGYLCAREEPPENCPICKASRERFERFWS